MGIQNETLIVALALFWAAATGAWLLWPHKKAKEGRQSMSKQDRRRHVNRELSDAIVEAVEGLVFKNRITRSEADKRYRMLAERCGLQDLIRPENTPLFTLYQNQDLKDRILIRRTFKIHTPVPLPDNDNHLKKVDAKAEINGHKRLLASLEQDVKLIEQSVSKLTRKERRQREADLNPDIKEK